MDWSTLTYFFLILRRVLFSIPLGERPTSCNFRQNGFEFISSRRLAAGGCSPLDSSSSGDVTPRTFEVMSRRSKGSKDMLSAPLFWVAFLVFAAILGNWITAIALVFRAFVLPSNVAYSLGIQEGGALIHSVSHYLRLDDPINVANTAFYLIATCICDAFIVCFSPIRSPLSRCLLTLCPVPVPKRYTACTSSGADDGGSSFLLR
ncbi:hypothetical protein NMY22_g1187 [Coprinellus aureogranulatus]|nr:hypothetical protein NMY22_g1187 [Coprinellus aureogranulatus]